MLRAERRSNKYQVYSLWFDRIGVRTQNLPHSRRERLAITPPMWLRYVEVAVMTARTELTVRTVRRSGRYDDA